MCAMWRRVSVVVGWCAVLASAGIVRNNVQVDYPDHVRGNPWRDPAPWSHARPWIPSASPGPWHAPSSIPLNFHISTSINLPAAHARDSSREEEDDSLDEEDRKVNELPQPEPSDVPVCGGPLRRYSTDRHGMGSGRQPGFQVWPWSTSQGSPLNVTTIHRGAENSKSYIIYFKNEDGPVSPFHDIPLFANEGNKIFNMVVEVPRWTNAKMEISTKEPLNPIKQDVKKGKLRYVANCFPHHGYIWNYGALPQTWEDPNHMDESTGCKGDNDPIDVCEIGYRVAKRGEVIQVKVLGTLALIDEGETDWKLIAIDVNDPMAPQLSDISDVEKHMPGFLKATVEWFRIYKIPDGKPENQFAFNAEARDRDFAHKIIMDTHEAWQNLVLGKSDAGGLDAKCVTVPNAMNKLSVTDADSIVESSPVPGPGQPVDPKVDLWHYVSLK